MDLYSRRSGPSVLLFFDRSSLVSTASSTAASNKSSSSSLPTRRRPSSAMELGGWFAVRGRRGGGNDPGEAFVSSAGRVTAAPPPAPTGSRQKLYRSLVASAGRLLRWRLRWRSQLRGCFGAGIEVCGRQIRPSPSSLLNGAGRFAVRRAWGWSRPTCHSGLGSAVHGGSLIRLRKQFLRWCFVGSGRVGRSSSSPSTVLRRRRRMMQDVDDELCREPQGPDCNLVPFSGVFSAYVLDSCVVWVLHLGAACVVLPVFAI